MPRLLSLLLPLCAVSLAAQSIDGPALRHVQAAQQAQAHQDCHTAAKEFGLAAQLTAGSGELRSNEGVALYCDGQWQQAIAALHKALLLNHNLTAPHLFLGLAAYHLSDTRMAVTELQTYLSDKPEDVLGRLWLGYAHAAEHQHAAAIQDFSAVLASHPGDVNAEYALGQSSLELGRDLIRQLQSLAPASPYLFQLAGEQYRTIGDEGQANKAFALAAGKQNVQPAAGSTGAAKEQQLYQQAHDAEATAQAAFDSVVKNAPDSDRAHEIRADAFLLQQQDTAALAEYRAAAAQNPTLPGIHASIASCLMQQSQFADALAELQTELRLQPESPEVLMELGRVQFAMGNTTAAIATLQKAAAHNNAPAPTYLLLGRALLQNNDARNAASALLTYIATQPDSATAHYLLARAYRILGDRPDMGKELSNYQRLSKNIEERNLVQSITEAPDQTREQPSPGSTDANGPNTVPPTID